MGAPAVGEVVLVPFPFSNLTQSKIRPAVCLADAGRGDFILCQITSQPYGDPLAIRVDGADFASGGLQVVSDIRPAKLFTGDATLIVRSAGKLAPDVMGTVRDTVVNLLRVGHS